MSIFSMGGNIGFSLGPLAAALIATVGMGFSVVLLVPGLIVTAFLAAYAPAMRPPQRSAAPGQVRAALRRTWPRLSAIVGIIAIRSGIQYVLLLFLPLYYHAHGLPAQIGSYCAFVLSLSGALGGLIGGPASDRFGRRVIVVVSLLLAMPLLVLSLMTTGPLVWPLLVLSGACLLASNSVTVVQGQELLPANTGIASGLTLGVGFGLSGIIGSAAAAVADHIGVETAIYIAPLLVPAASALALFVPDRALATAQELVA